MNQKDQRGYRYIRWILIALLAISFSAISAHPVSADDEDDDEVDFVAQQVVVKLNPTSNAAIDEINALYGTVTLNAVLSSRGIYLLQILPGSDGDNDDDDEDPVLEKVEEMNNDPRLLYVEPNYLGSPPESNGRSRFGWGGADAGPTNGQYAVTMLELPAAHNMSRGAGSIVAVLDTGFQLDHPGLAGRLTDARYDFVDDDAVPNEDFANLDQNGDGIVDEMAGHGTHVATTVLLVAPDARIMPIRVLDANGRGNIFLIAEAVNFAVQNDANVINLSLGTEAESEILGDVIDYAINAGMTVVAAAGNLTSSQPMFPAAEENVIAVAAVDQNGVRASFSNHGPWIGAAAPGEHIYSAFPINGYANWSGTSMATPMVAGHAALLWTAYPDSDAAGIVNRILATAEPLQGELGAGLIDPLSSLQPYAPGPTSEAENDDDDAIDDEIDDEGDGANDDDDGEASTRLFLPVS